MSGTKRRIAVLMGGDSHERDVSRVSGEAVASALASRGHDVTLVDTAKGVIALPEASGSRIGSAPPDDEMSLPVERTQGVALDAFTEGVAGADAVFLALHGGWGENGKIQAVLELTNVPYTGSGVLGSALAMDKDRAKRVLRDGGFATPPWGVVTAREGRVSAAEVERAATAVGDGTTVVKPNEEGSTVGLHIVEPGGDLLAAVRDSARYGERILLEKFVPGRELTAAVLGDRALPVVEIIPEGGVYTYEAKYTKGKSRYVVPADLPDDLGSMIRAAALDSFRLLGLEGFARLDYRLAPDGGVWFLEANTIPGMTALSLVPMAAKAAGLSFEELLEEIVELGIARAARGRRASGVGGPA